MIVFDELLAPVLPIIRTVEQKRRAHFNEKLTWPDFTRILIYFFTKNLVSASELLASIAGTYFIDKYDNPLIVSTADQSYAIGIYSRIRS